MSGQDVKALGDSPRKEHSWVDMEFFVELTIIERDVDRYNIVSQGVAWWNH